MLQRRAIFGAAALLLAIFATQLGRVSTSAEDKRESPARADNQVESDVRTQTERLDEPRADEKTVEIPLSSIVTTSPQNGMLNVREALDQQTPDRTAKSAHGYLTQILQANKGGASNVFLVDAGNAPSAIAASFRVFVGPWTANTPAYENTPDPNRGLHWLVAYLGWGDPHAASWEIDEVRREGNLITLRYRKTRSPEDSDQDHLYFYWVPLAKLPPGSYEVKLEDADSLTTTLMRRVEVSR